MRLPGFTLAADPLPFSNKKISVGHANALARSSHIKKVIKDNSFLVQNAKNQRIREMERTLKRDRDAVAEELNDADDIPADELLTSERVGKSMVFNGDGPRDHKMDESSPDIDGERPGKMTKIE